MLISNKGCVKSCFGEDLNLGLKYENCSCLRARFEFSPEQDSMHHLLLKLYTNIVTRESVEANYDRITKFRKC